MMRTVPMLLVTALLPACASSTGDAAEAFVGAWACTGSSTLTYTTPAGMAPKLSTSSSTLTITDNGDGTITALNDNANGGSCALRSTVSGTSYTVETDPPQSCTNNGVTNTYDKGIGTLSADGMTLTRSSSFAETSASVVAMGSGSSTCTRM